MMTMLMMISWIVYLFVWLLDDGLDYDDIGDRYY